jgi:hypothetical protein
MFHEILINKLTHCQICNRSLVNYKPPQIHSLNLNIKLKIRQGATAASIDNTGIFGFGIDFTGRTNLDIASTLDLTFATTPTTATVIDLNTVSFGQFQKRDMFIGINCFS